MMYRFLLSFALLVSLSSSYMLASDDPSDDSSDSQSNEEMKSNFMSPVKHAKKAALGHAGVPVVQADTVSRLTTYLWCQMPGRKYRTIVEASINRDGTLAEPVLSYAKADQTNYFSKAVNECSQSAQEKAAKNGEGGDHLLRAQAMLKVAQKYQIEVMQGAKDSVYQELKSIMKKYTSFLRLLEADPMIRQLHPEIEQRRTRKQRRNSIASSTASTSGITNTIATGTTSTTTTNALKNLAPAAVSSQRHRRSNTSRIGLPRDHYKTAFMLSEVDLGTSGTATTTTTAGVMSAAPLASLTTQQSATTTFTSFPMTRTTNSEANAASLERRSSQSSGERGSISVAALASLAPGRSGSRNSVRSQGSESGTESDKESDASSQHSKTRVQDPEKQYR